MSKTPEALPPSPPSATTGVGSTNYMEQYLNASITSAGRARFVLLVMVTASVLSLLAMWNSRQGNMTLARLKVATNAQKFFDSNDKKTILADDDVRPLFNDKDGKFDEAAFNSAKSFLGQQRGRFADLEHLRRYIEALERTRIERIVNVSIPFFGSAFDINDLGMFAGVSFFIILLLFRFSLFRELRNVRLVFKQAHTVEQLELCYNRLAMQQVLTIPPPLDTTSPDEAKWGDWLRVRGLFWDNVSRLLFALPLIAHILIFWNDWGTYDVRNVYPSIGISQWVSGIFLFLNALLTAVGLSLSLKLDKTWRNHARFIIKHRTVTPVDIAEEEAEEEEAEGGPPELEPAREGAPAVNAIETEKAGRG